MKNIFLISSDKSILYTHQGKLYDNRKTMHIPDGTQIPKHIYITSDEEIISSKDWFIDIKDNRNHLHQVGYGLDSYEWTEQYDPQYYKKIVLTTDPTLIADGVQAIDDHVNYHFPEWLVENPNCEFVEVKKKLIEFPLTFKMLYKIIIPKEQQKQHLINMMHDDEELGLYEEPKQETKCYCGHTTYCDCGPLEGTCEYCESKESKRILDEAKEQKSKDYSEEEVRELIIKALTHNDDKLCGSLVTVEKEIRTANFNVWFDENKKK